MLWNVILGIPIYDNSTYLNRNWRLYLFDKLCAWWRHQIEISFAILATCAGNSPVTDDLPHKGQWHRALMSSSLCAWRSGWVNSRKACDLRRHCDHYNVTIMWYINANSTNRSTKLKGKPCILPCIHARTHVRIRQVVVAQSICLNVHKHICAHR